MFRRLQLRFRAVSTIKALSLGAEKHARARGEQQPGAEHFLLAAIDLPDGTAKRAFERVGARAEGVGAAIASQYDAALRSVGVDPERLQNSVGEDVVVPAVSALYKAQPSAQTLMRDLAAAQSKSEDAPLVGALVVAIIATYRYGVAARALRSMGVDTEALRLAAQSEAASFDSSVD